MQGYINREWASECERTRIKMRVSMRENDLGREEGEEERERQRVKECRMRD